MRIRCINFPPHPIKVACPLQVGCPEKDKAKCRNSAFNKIYPTYIVEDVPVKIFRDQVSLKIPSKAGAFKDIIMRVSF